MLVVKQRRAQVAGYAAILLVATAVGAAAVTARVGASAGLVVGVLGICTAAGISLGFSRHRVEATPTGVIVVGDRSRTEFSWAEVLRFEFVEEPPQAVLRTTDGWPTRLRIIEGAYFQRSSGQLEWARQQVENLERYRQGDSVVRPQHKKRRRR